MENNHSLTPIDKTGLDSLKVLSKADHFNKWMFDTIKPFVFGNILEIGSGIGNISSYFIQNNSSISLSDIDDFYLENLKKKFSEFPCVKDIFYIDLELEDFQETYPHLKEKYDTVLFVNVLEHIQRDRKAIEHSRFLLKEGGNLIILVPAYSFLYSKLDAALNHYRRYNGKNLSEMIGQNQFVVKNQLYFNALGIVAWVYGKIWGLKKIPSTEMNLFDRLTFWAKWIDKLLFNKIGLSQIVVAKKA